MAFLMVVYSASNATVNATVNSTATATVNSTAIGTANATVIATDYSMEIEMVGFHWLLAFLMGTTTEAKVSEMATATVSVKASTWAI